MFVFVLRYLIQWSNGTAG